MEVRMRLREERAHGPAQQDNIISSLDRPRERRLVAIEPAQDALEESRRAALDERRGFIVAVELEERREERQDESKRDLGSANSKSVSHAQPNTQPAGKERAYKIEQKRDKDDPQHFGSDFGVNGRHCRKREATMTSGVGGSDRQTNGNKQFEKTNAQKQDEKR